jgi:hypothetical protein
MIDGNGFGRLAMKRLRISERFATSIVGRPGGSGVPK